MNNIQNHFKNSGLTREQFARLYGVPLNTMRNWLTGTRDPGPAVFRLNEILGLIEIINPDLYANLIKESK